MPARTAAAAADPLDAEQSQELLVLGWVAMSPGGAERGGQKLQGGRRSAVLPGLVHWHPLGGPDLQSAAESVGGWHQDDASLRSCSAGGALALLKDEVFRLPLYPGCRCGLVQYRRESN